MGSLRRRLITLSLFLLVLPLTASNCTGRDFDVVHGRYGWTAQAADTSEPSVDFNVSDTLVFLRKKKIDTVLWVSQRHYEACNTAEPFLRVDSGDLRFVLNNTGCCYYFISADAGRCSDHGERIVACTTDGSPPPPPPGSSSAPSPSEGTNASSSSLAPSSSSSTAPNLPGTPSSATPSARNASSSSPAPSTTAPNLLPPPSSSSTPPAGNASVSWPAPLAIMPGTNRTTDPPPCSSAVAMRSGVLPSFLVGAAIILA